MKSWIHEISESYISTHKPVRRDLKENYVSLNEEQRFGLLSENVLNYLDEQLQNAYGFGVNDLTEEQLNELLGFLRNAGRNVGRNVKKAAKGAADITKRVAKGAALAGALAGGAASGSQHDSIHAPEGAPVIGFTNQGKVEKVGSVTSDGLVGREDGTLVQSKDGKGNAVAVKAAGKYGTPVNSDGIAQIYHGRLPNDAAVQSDDEQTLRAVKGAYAKVARIFDPAGPKVVNQAGGMSQTRPRWLYNQ